MQDNFTETTYIVRDLDGNYRWTYDVDSSSNRSFLNLYLLIFALIILIPGAILFFMLAGKGADMGMFLLIWLGIFAGVELLTILIYKAVEKAKGSSTDIPYLMNENFIVVHPGDRKTPEFYLRTDFSNVKDIRVDKEHDLITLHEFARVTHVYVHYEDFPFVLNFIFEHTPQTKKIAERKAQYQKEEL